MSARAGKAFAALLLWFAFTVGALVVLVLQPFGLLGWFFTGKQWLYDWVKTTGKGTDALNNGAWFGGNVKETISSHAGRLMVRQRDQGIPAPVWARAIAWLLNRFDDNHAIDAIEEPFRNEPL